MEGFKGVALVRFTVNDINFEGISSLIAREHSLGLNECVCSVPCHCHVGLAIGFVSHPSLKYGELGLNVSLGVPTLDDVFAVTAKEVIDRLDSHADRAGRFIFVEIFEGKIWGS